MVSKSGAVYLAMMASGNLRACIGGTAVYSRSFYTCKPNYTYPGTIREELGERILTRLVEW